MNISHVVKSNISEVTNFFISYLPADIVVSPNKPDKIAINCPFCDGNRKRHKMLINIDWNDYRCFRCGESGTLLNLCKHFNIQNDFLALLSVLSKASIFDILKSNKEETLKENIKTAEDDQKNAEAKKFITNNGLFPITDLSYAYKYALNRTYNNQDEVENYYADDKYIYIPIITENKIVSFCARLYSTDDEKNHRYKMFNIINNAPSVGFFDEVTMNISTNSIYITEGYFDSYAINYAMSNYVSVCTFGKSKVVQAAKLLAKTFPVSTKIYLTLDSVLKDKNIVKDNIKYGEKIQKIFPNLYIVELPNSDPADIVKNNGTVNLKYTLDKNSVPFIMYTLKNLL